jgi:hypothetical protein
LNYVKDREFLEHLSDCQLLENSSFITWVGYDWISDSSVLIRGPLSFSVGSETQTGLPWCWEQGPWHIIKGVQRETAGEGNTFVWSIKRGYGRAICRSEVNLCSPDW